MTSSSSCNEDPEVLIKDKKYTKKKVVKEIKNNKTNEGKKEKERQGKIDKNKQFKKKINRNKKNKKIEYKSRVKNRKLVNYKKIKIKHINNFIVKDNFPETNNTLKVWYTNATSLKKKMNELRIISLVKKPHVIMITETWFNEQTVSTIENYKCYRKDRKDDNFGGGVCIYIRRDIPSSEASEQQLTKGEIEQVWCKIDTGTENIEKSIEKAYSFVLNKKINGTIIARDFNLKIKWKENSGESFPISFDGKAEKKFIKCLEDFFMSQHVHLPTFQTSLSDVTEKLDLIVTECPERLRELRLGPGLGKFTKAHLSIEFVINIKEKPKTNPYHSNSLIYKNGNYTKMNEMFLSKNWRSLMDNLSPHDQYISFLKEYNNVVRELVPQIKIRSVNIFKPKPPWLNNEISKKVKEKYNLWRKFLASGRKNIQ